MIKKAIVLLSSSIVVGMLYFILLTNNHLMKSNLDNFTSFCDRNLINVANGLTESEMRLIPGGACNEECSGTDPGCGLRVGQQSCLPCQVFFATNSFLIFP